MTFNIHAIPVFCLLSNSYLCVVQLPDANHAACLAAVGEEPRAFSLLQQALGCFESALQNGQSVDRLSAFHRDVYARLRRYVDTTREEGNWGGQGQGWGGASNKEGNRQQQVLRAAADDDEDEEEDGVEVVRGAAAATIDAVGGGGGTKKRFQRRAKKKTS
jgi:hypothetical protein